MGHSGNRGNRGNSDRRHSQADEERLRAQFKKELAVERAASKKNLKQSVLLAKDIFQVATPTPDMVFTVYEIVFGCDEGADRDDAISDLKASVTDAKEVFGVDSPTPEMVIGVFGSIYAGYDEDEDEDDEDDDE